PHKPFRSPGTAAAGRRLSREGAGEPRAAPRPDMETQPMLSRRELLKRSLQGAALLSFGNAVPGFLARTAAAAEVGKDNILVVIEMTGGNDGLNMCVPYADDLYHAARPTLRFTKEQVVRVDDKIGLNPSMRSFDRLLQRGELAVVLGVGYPNPDR